MKKLLWIGLACLVVFVGCNLVTRDFYLDVDDLPENGKGMLVLILDESRVKSITIAPDPLVMVIASYDVIGNITGGAAGNEFAYYPTVAEVISGVYTINNVTPGEWTIDITARNSSGDQIGSGSTGTFNVVPNKVTSVPVDVTPDTGPSFPGSLSLSILWLPDSVPFPSVTATLTPLEPVGSAINISSSEFTGSVESGFDVINTANQATYADTSLDAGYYSLSLDLYAYSSITPEWVMGDNVSVRIVNLQSTAGVWDLTSSVGDIGVVITPDLKNPIIIALTSVVVSGTTEDVTATLTSDPSETYDYAWYIDGRTTPEITNTNAGTSNTFTLNPDSFGLPSGGHNLSVLVTARTGGAIDSVSSATYPFTVQ